MKRWNQSGFSAVELMVVVTIFGITAVALAPGFSRSWKRSALDSNAIKMETAMKLCRQKAIMNRRPYRLIMDPSDHTFYSMRRDSGGVWVMDPPETTFIKDQINFISRGDNHDLFFETRGTVAASDSPAEVRFFNDRGETLAINLVRTGRIRVVRTAGPSS